MELLNREAEIFKLRGTDEKRRIGATIALQLLCGEDLNLILIADNTEKQRVVRKLRHRLERERLRGLRGHWSYDLNRHIGLRQALDLIGAVQS